ncbi:hypothetical protein K402DRAFT_405719 [Aulographum hederae CBS 113979]|uniref:Uncharacterized protein n=1 Tax=Aulographum hederae CBS 113979 TaxID=1176131 RepID=A0A6G1GW17_9PEZI|nr:hypothetical protein K402DRAFT_405719 [Aulographum hederae CBS 113979]
MAQTTTSQEIPLSQLISEKWGCTIEHAIPPSILPIRHQKRVHNPNQWKFEFRSELRELLNKSSDRHEAALIAIVTAILRRSSQTTEVGSETFHAQDKDLAWAQVALIAPRDSPLRIPENSNALFHVVLIEHYWKREIENCIPSSLQIPTGDKISPDDAIGTTREAILDGIRWNIQISAILEKTARKTKDKNDVVREMLKNAADELGESELNRAVLRKFWDTTKEAEKRGKEERARQKAESQQENQRNVDPSGSASAPREIPESARSPQEHQGPKRKKSRLLDPESERQRQKQSGAGPSGSSPAFLEIHESAQLEKGSLETKRAELTKKKKKRREQVDKEKAKLGEERAKLDKKIAELDQKSTELNQEIVELEKRTEEEEDLPLFVGQHESGVHKRTRSKVDQGDDE